MQNREIIQVVISGTDTCKIQHFINNIHLKSDALYDYYLPENTANDGELPALIDLQILDIEFYQICAKHPPYAIELLSTIKNAYAFICVDSYNEVEFCLSPLFPDGLFINYHEHEMTPDECLISIGHGVSNELISLANEKATILCESSYRDSDSIFNKLPKEVTAKIAQFYIQAEFKNDPVSFAFFSSEKNYKQPELPETSINRLKSRL